MIDQSLPRPSVTEHVAGHEVARRYAGVEEEYTAMRTTAIAVDRSERSRALFSGAKSGEVLAGLVTNDIVGLAPGHGLYAAALTPKGKIIADPRIFARAADYLVDVPPRAAAGWWAMVRKFVNPRLASYEDVSAQLADLSVFGMRARGITARALGIPEGTLDVLPSYGHVQLAAGSDSLMVARVPCLGVEGFTLFVPSARRDEMLQALLSAGATPAGSEVVDLARIESGRPEWGVEIDETTIPQEANLDALHAISYTKGCYTGQETVARVHFRGHVNRQLRGLSYPMDLALPVRAEVVDESGKVVGDVRSVGVSPRLGGVALAMVRREVVPGSRVSVRWDGGEGTALMLELPFPGA